MKNKLKSKLRKWLLTIIALFAVVYTGGVSSGASGSVSAPAGLLLPAAAGTEVVENEKAVVDISNAGDGYFMARYLQAGNSVLKVMIKSPGGTTYTYSLKADGSYETYPFSDGSGTYTIGVYEQVAGTKYATAITASANVALTDDFAPFIRPNQYVNYTGDSDTVRIAGELTAGVTGTEEKISAIYNYVLDSLGYDTAQAASVQSGYVPDGDAVLAKGTGICFDYAAVMAAMLRSQRIPAKLAVGYAGEIYHAWVYVCPPEAGTVNGVVKFDGKTWTLMDPTFADTGNQGEEVMKFIGDGKNYTVKYFY